MHVRAKVKHVVLHSTYWVNRNTTYIAFLVLVKHLTFMHVSCESHTGVNPTHWWFILSHAGADLKNQVLYYTSWVDTVETVVTAVTVVTV